MDLKLPGSRSGPLPLSFTPQLAMPSKTAPEGDRWLHEIKFDGYRMICRIDGADVRFNTRSGLDWTDKLDELSHAAGCLSARQAVLDGEVVVLAPNGTTNFEALQRSLGRRGETGPLYYVFDLLCLDGFDLCGVELQHRKTALT